MARKKLRKVLAWTLAATIAVIPVNMTWASESADLFSDSSENIESVEMAADKTDSLQQEEADTQPIVSGGEEEDTFTMEDSVEVFSAGDESDGNEKSSDEAQIITVNANEAFIFQPKKEATYCISTNKDNAFVNIKISPTSGVESYSGYCTLKTSLESSYQTYIAGIDGDVKITIKEVQNLIRQISRSLFTANSFGVFTTTPER